MCAVCYSTSIVPMTPALIAQMSFGLSLSGDALAKSALGTRCSTDYLTVRISRLILNRFLKISILQIPNAFEKTNVANTITIAGNSRFCGRVLHGTDNMAVPSQTVCSNFKISRF